MWGRGWLLYPQAGVGRGLNYRKMGATWFLLPGRVHASSFCRPLMSARGCYPGSQEVAGEGRRADRGLPAQERASPGPRSNALAPCRHPSIHQLRGSRLCLPHPCRAVVPSAPGSMRHWGHSGPGRAPHWWLCRFPGAVWVGTAVVDHGQLRWAVCPTQASCGQDGTWPGGLWFLIFREETWELGAGSRAGVVSVALSVNSLGVPNECLALQCH